MPHRAEANGPRACEKADRRARADSQVARTRQMERVARMRPMGRTPRMGGADRATARQVARAIRRVAMPESDTAAMAQGAAAAALSGRRVPRLKNDFIHVTSS